MIMMPVKECIDPGSYLTFDASDQIHSLLPIYYDIDLVLRPWPKNKGLFKVGILSYNDFVIIERKDNTNFPHVNLKIVWYKVLWKSLETLS